MVHTHANSPFSGQIGIGCDPQGGDGEPIFNGIVDEVAIFDYSLSAAAIDLLYSAASAAPVPPFVLTVAPVTKGQFTLEFSGMNGQSYVVEMSTNLAAGNWTPVYTNVQSWRRVYLHRHKHGGRCPLLPRHAISQDLPMTNENDSVVRTGLRLYTNSQYVKNTLLAKGNVMKMMKAINVFYRPAMLLVFLAAWVGMACAGDTQTTNMIVLTNNAGLQWNLENQGSGWALGQVLFHGNPVDNPLLSGVICLHPENNSGDVWLLATNAVQVDNRTATLSGSQLVDGVMVRFEVAVSLNEDLPKAELIAHWSVNTNLNGWDVAMAYHGVGTNQLALHDLSVCRQLHDRGARWRRKSNRLLPMERWILKGWSAIGVPSVILFRPDMSLVALFGIDPAFDYLDFTNWTANTGFYFENQVTPPQFRVGPSANTVGAGNFIAGVKYVMPLQIILNDSGNSVQAITQLAGDWVQANHYAVQPMSIRTPDQAFEIFLQGRRNTPVLDSQRKAMKYSRAVGIFTSPTRQKGHI